MIDRLNEVKGNPYHTHGEGNKDKDGFTVEPQNQGGDQDGRVNQVKSDQVGGSRDASNETGNMRLADKQVCGMSVTRVKVNKSCFGGRKQEAML
jgi:hypothetical protein